MLYQLTYRIETNNTELDLEIEESIKRLDYHYVQQLNWTSGHFIIENFENHLIKTLVAFPHIIKPDRELILIQEYILDRLGIYYGGIVLHKWISNRNDDIDNEYILLPNNLIIRHYHQDSFFKKVLQISINEKSPGIAAEFYANYYFIGNINFDQNIHNTTFKYSENDTKPFMARFEKAYKLRQNESLPIFIVNEQNKLSFTFLRELIINQIKKDYHLELKFTIQTRIDNDLLLSEIEYINTIQFSNNILGQVWDITIDINYTTSSSLLNVIKTKLIPIISSNRLHTLIIIRNSKLITINDWLSFDTYINF